MPTITDRITILIIREINGELSQADRNELEQWMGQSPVNREVAEEFTREDRLQGAVSILLSKEKVWQRVAEALGQAKVVPIKRNLWKRIAVAASVLVLVGLGYMVMRPTKKSAPEIAEVKDVQAPITTKAVIKLADGREVAIEDLTSVEQGTVQIRKTADGKIIYTGVSSDLVYNTLSNPRGSKVIDMTLAEGSRVWLNAGSSITYPVAFMGNERKVSMKGEGYFEVSKDAIKKFIVDANGVTTEVLGTHFNVNAYEDEAETKVTLLEGSVKIGNSVLKPGEQAVAREGELKVMSGVDLAQVMAWKDGWFEFDNADVRTVLRQISRWYDLELVYQSQPTTKFGGRISRELPLSAIMKMMSENGVKLELNGKKLVVK